MTDSIPTNTGDLLENLVDGVLVVDMDGIVQYANLAAQQMFTGLKTPLIGYHLGTFLTPEESAAFLELPGKGDARHVELRANKVEWKGQPATLVTLRDVTETKKLNERNEELSRIVESSDNAIIGTTLEGIITSWNGGAERMYGYTADEALEQNISMLVPDDRPDDSKQILDRIQQGEYLHHDQTIRKSKDGSLLHVSLSVSPIRDNTDTIIGAAKIAQDVTSKVKAHKRIDHLNQVLQSIREVNRLIIHQQEPAELIQNVCDTLVRSGSFAVAWIVLLDEKEDIRHIGHAGLDAEAADRFFKSWRDQGTPDFCREVAKEGEKLLDHDFPESTFPVADVCKGCSRYISHLSHSGTSYGFLSICSSQEFGLADEDKVLVDEVAGDLALALQTIEWSREREHTLAILRHQEELLNETGELAKVGGWELNLDENTVGWTPTTKQIHEVAADFQPSLEEALDFFPECRESIKQALRRAREQGVPYAMEVPLVTAKGNKIWVKTIGMSEMEDGRCRRLHGVIQDITEQKSMEAELLQAQKLDSIGQLAGGVAHDFNNFLMGIMGYTDLCREKVGKDHEISPWLEEIIKQTQRSAHLTRQLLAFARKESITPEVLDLNEVVESMLKMLRRLIGEDIDLEWHPGKETMWLRMDPGQIDQILANLCVNAQDAIGGVGRVSIHTRVEKVKEPMQTEDGILQEGDYVQLKVEDDGCGMDVQTLEHIFEPFYTTKGVGEGTGLGLSTVYGIVKQNKGFLRVDSETGHGTSFYIFLPLYEKAGTKAKDLTPQQTPAGRGETILVVEDEKGIREALNLCLHQLGYKVLTAEHPEHALRIAAEYSGKIDLMVTDVIMPGMNGRQLADKMVSENPDLKVLYMSGYTADIITERGVMNEGVQFIQKPISIQGLATKMREVLDKGIK